MGCRPEPDEHQQSHCNHVQVHSVQQVILQEWTISEKNITEKIIHREEDSNVEEYATEKKSKPIISKSSQPRKYIRIYTHMEQVRDVVNDSNSTPWRSSKYIRKIYVYEQVKENRNHPTMIKRPKHIFWNNQTNEITKFKTLIQLETRIRCEWVLTLASTRLRAR